MRFVGDCHGKIPRLLALLDEFPDGEIIQLGDMGLGFDGVFLPKRPKRFRFIRGNHDNPQMCRAHANYLGDFGYLPEHKLFYLAGAWSIDANWRIPDVSWWRDEELSITELNNALELFIETKPETVISHECPSSAAKILLADLEGGYFAAKGECIHSRTSQALQQMFEAHQPREWFFGHYHIDKTFELTGTHFTCLAELSVGEPRKEQSDAS